MADLWLQFLLTVDATLRVATPLILCAMAGIFSEKSGIIDISLEGKMLMSAFAAAAVAAVTSSALAGLVTAIGVSVLLGLLHGLASITLRGNQVISGLAINILASGLTITIGTFFIGSYEAVAAGADAANLTAPLSSNCLLYTSPRPRDQRGSGQPGWG